MKKIVTSLALAGFLFSGSLLARENFTDFGRVLHAQPVYDYTYSRPHRHEDCRSDYRPHRSGHRHSEKHDIAPVAGAIVGGIIGNKLGRGDARVLTTVAGSLAGAAIASNHSQDHYRHGRKDPKHNNRDHHRHDRHDRHCRSKGHRKHRVLTGFDVTYRYKGEIFHTFTRRHPGKRIRLDVSIRPLDR